MLKQKTNLKIKSSRKIRSLRLVSIRDKSSFRRRYLISFLRKAWRLLQNQYPQFKRISIRSLTRSQYKIRFIPHTQMREKLVYQNKFRIKKTSKKRFYPKETKNRVSVAKKRRLLLKKNEKKTLEETVKNPRLNCAYLRSSFFKSKSRRYRYKTKLKYVLKRARKKFPLIRSAIIHIKLRRRNTFLTCNSRRKRTLFTSSTGTFKYDGRKKSTVFARERLARKVAQKLVRKHFRVVDIYFVSKVGPFYRSIVKAAISTGLILRMLKIKRLHSHGMIRPKKAKRK